MAIITTTDLYTVIYQTIIDEITRENGDLVTTAIDNAIDEVKLYVTRYDILQLFGDENTAPTVASPLLKKFCINLACWNIISLGNPNIDYEHIKMLYERTIEQLKMIQKQQTQPAGWPYKDTTGQTAPQGSSVHGTSFSKRNNNF